jgi:hypothetical protein
LVNESTGRVLNFVCSRDRRRRKKKKRRKKKRRKRKK